MEADVRFVHTNALHPEAQEGGIYSWYKHVDGTMDECTLQRTTNYGIYIETTTNPSYFENWTVCLNYFVSIYATNPQGTQLYIYEFKNLSKWVEATVRYD